MKSAASILVSVALACGCGGQFGDRGDAPMFEPSDATSDADTRATRPRPPPPPDTWSDEDTGAVEDAAGDALPPPTPSALTCSWSTKFTISGAASDSLYNPADIAVDGSGKPLHRRRLPRHRGLRFRVEHRQRVRAEAR